MNKKTKTRPPVAPHLDPTSISRFLVAGVFIMLAVLIRPTDALPASHTIETNPIDRAQIESIVRDFIMRNPEVIVDSVRALDRRKRAEAARQVSNVLRARADDIFNNPESPIGGNPNGDVTIVEFFDYQCGYCKRVYPHIKRLLTEDKNVRLVFKEFPILGDASVFAARAALAAERQGGYQAFHDRLMKAKGALRPEMVLAMARGSGLDEAAIRRDMGHQSVTFNRIIGDVHDLARALDITGTPAFVIGDQVVRGAVDYAGLKSLIAAARSLADGKGG